jgi:DNA-binding NtrC family response regulator
MTPSLQMKLLRVLQQKTFERVGGKETLNVDVRVIAATNNNLELEMKEGRFREDLFYRLNVIHILVPPLRDHPEDIPILTDHFIKRYGGARTVTVAPGVMVQLRAQSWPGNVRELENVIQRALVMAQGNVITLDHLPIEPLIQKELAAYRSLSDKRTSLKKLTAGFEKNLIQRALADTSWNRTKAAQLLQINRRLLFSKIQRYRIRAPKRKSET